MMHLFILQCCCYIYLHLIVFVGGHAKTLMLVHINPVVNAIGETVGTLKFAERVALIELGSVRSNKETGEIQELKEEVDSWSIVCSIVLVNLCTHLYLFICN